MTSFTLAQIVAEGLLMDLALAEKFVQIALTDTMDLFATNVISYVGDASGAGSNVLRSRLIGLGWNLPMEATAAETTTVTASSVDGTYTDVTVARRALRLDESGLAQIVGGRLGFDPVALGQTMTDSFLAGRMGAFGVAIAAATNNITSASMGDVDDLFDIIDEFALNGYHGELVGALHPTTQASIRDSLRGEVGPIAYRGDVQAFRAMGVEQILGITIMPTLNVTTNAGNYENAVMAPGAIGYGIGSPNRIMTTQKTMKAAGMPMVIDFEKDASSDNLKIIGNGYDGQSIREQARIVGLLASTT